MSMFRNLLMQKKDNDYIKDGLFVYYSGLDNTGSGHSTSANYWKDLSGNNNDGYLATGTAYWNTNSMICDYSSAYGVFNIANKSIQNLFVGDSFTISVTYKASSSSLNNYCGLFGNHGDGQKGLLCQYEGGKIGGLLIGQYMTQTASDIFTSNTNHNITFVINKDGNDYVYLDGSLYATQSFISGRFSTNLKFYIGTSFWPSGSLDSGRKFRGNIYNFLLYNKALSENEIQHNYLVDQQKYFS